MLLYVLRIGQSVHFASVDKRETIRCYQSLPTKELQNVATIYTVELSVDFATLTIAGEFKR